MTKRPMLTLLARGTRNRSDLDYDAAIQVFRVLRARATIYAFAGTVIAVIAVILATLLVCVHVYDGITLDNALRAHGENIAIQALDAMPFLFAWWGQYASARMAAEAGSMVQSRTDDLQRELETARYTARAKTDFFARMSHELRTPINAIVGMSELLMDAEDPEQRRHQAQVIHDSAYGLLSLVNDVLDFSRIEAGRMELDDVGFDLHDHLNGTATLMEQQATAKGLGLTCLVPPDAPRRVVGDPGRLRQIVVNLVGNAIKFTEAGEVVLSLKRWRPLPEGGHEIRIEIADTGIGMAPEEQKRLFEPYRRGPDESREGTGLGLSITRELVHAMDGEIHVESEPGHGSVFAFTVQLGAAAAPDPGEPAPTLRGRRVLLADPVTERREALAGQLRALGLWVTQVGDGVEAMQTALRAAAEQSPYDLLLADLFLPHLSGERLGARLKQRPETASTCLAVMTATGARGDAKRLNEAGFAGYLTRPLAPERLEPLLQAILATRDLPEAERRRRGLVTRYHVEEARAPCAPVLVVDDSPVNREITQHHLARLGYESRVAEDGAAALATLEHDTYAAVLLDLRLPDMEGTEVVRRVRAREPDLTRTPVLVLTAGASEEQRRACEKAGIEGFMTRPVDGETLRRNLAASVAPMSESEPQPASAEPVSVSPRLARVFLDETADRVGQMQAGLAVGGDGDLERIGRHAHSIASAAHHFPDTGLIELGRRMERLANAGDLAGARETFAPFEQAWTELRGTLEDVAERA